MGSNYAGAKYNVDVVLCIDATYSMEPVLNMVKEHALSFYDDVIQELAAKNKIVSGFRVRLIAYRDYIADGPNAMLLTDFFALPEQTSEFEKAINSVKPLGGGDDPEDGLESIGYAIRSKWCQEGKRRHIIVVWSDDATHELGFGCQSPYYPPKMAKDFSELMTWWDEMDYNSKRLLIYAPAREYWTTISENWDNAIHFPSEAGNGLDKVTYKEILGAIANSV